MMINKIMHEDLVTFQTAVLAKEKGFDWKVRYSFGHKINPHIAYHKEDFDISTDFNSPNIGRNWKHLFSAPTQSLLQKWLREKHGLYVNVEFYENNNYRHSHAFSISTRHALIKDYNFEDNVIYDYEQALEDGLQQALEEI